MISSLKKRLSGAFKELQSSREERGASLSDAIASGKHKLAEHLLERGTNRMKHLLSVDEEDALEIEDESTEREEEGKHGMLTIVLKGVSNIPVNTSFLNTVFKNGYWVTVECNDIHETTEVVWSKKGSVEFSETFELKLDMYDTLKFSLHAKYFETQNGKSSRLLIGSCEAVVKDLLRGSSVENVISTSMWLANSSSIYLFDECYEFPCEIGFDIVLSDTFQAIPIASETKNWKKHVFVCTRGTRGDVQPFIALAIGLATQHDFLITICTEMRYKPLVENYSKVKRGKIQFKPSGGDTEKRISSALATWAMQQKSTAMQMFMLGYGEREFFESEPAFNYWVGKLQPDLLLFGFTTANVAMVLSEQHQIPLIGFLLQPTVLPSKQYPAIARIRADTDAESSHKIHQTLKLLLEQNPIDQTSALNSIRNRRGLKPMHFNSYQVIADQNVPVVVPINQHAFGGRPSDWHSNAKLTDFIFLRTGEVPNLSATFVRFIAEAKFSKEPLIVMAFSSMPVARTRILELALKLIDESVFSPRVIALVGNQNAVPIEALNERVDALETRAKTYVKAGKLLVAPGAPFGKLFPQSDLIIAHGGLGTTGEALRAAKPCLTTGVLILDQRFWGRRVYELGLGPAPEHVKDLHRTLIEDVDSCLKPDSSFRVRAAQVASLLGDEDDDGVDINVKSIVDLMKVATPITFENVQSRTTFESVSKWATSFTGKLLQTNQS